ncbi:hypothetical protein [Paludisphaera rhizosphaerae]|uniref:hypothetical protein n=1 Tax=Paludisphaera rhizosphaerae TaxID=2711216 RepID=UPI00198054AD|nr:hypothetical protein [Paludisphaera rhizosphaerae]
MLDRLHSDGVAHLLMKTRVGFRRLKTVGREQCGLVQVDRRISGVAGGIDVDDLDVLADWARPEAIFPRDFDRDAAHAGQLIAGGERRIEGEDP